MRALKRWWKNARAERCLAPRRDEIAAMLKTHLRLSRPPRLLRGGGMGHDSNYFVQDADKTIIGVLRIVNPYKKRAQPPPAMPYALPEPETRIAREAHILKAASLHGLTPAVLWSCGDALLASHMPLRPMEKMLKDDPGRAWELLVAAATRLGDLHRHGFTHMDASLANMLADDGLEKMVFVDFEYAPAAHVAPAQQRIYDHLRLVESVYKYIPDISACVPWLRAFSSLVDDDMRAADIAPLAPALGRVLGNDILSREIKRCLS